MGMGKPNLSIVGKRLTSPEIRSATAEAKKRVAKIEARAENKYRLLFSIKNKRSMLTCAMLY